MNYLHSTRLDTSQISTTQYIIMVSTWRIYLKRTNHIESHKNHEQNGEEDGVTGCKLNQHLMNRAELS